MFAQDRSQLIEMLGLSEHEYTRFFHSLETQRNRLNSCWVVVSCLIPNHAKEDISHLLLLMCEGACSPLREDIWRRVQEGYECDAAEEEEAYKHYLKEREEEWLAQQAETPDNRDDYDDIPF